MDDQHTVTVDEVRAAAEAIADDIVDTPLAHSATLSRLTGAEVHVKFENLQFTGSFKDRGAANHLRLLDPDVRRRGVVAFSAGNHAQGVAYHAARLGIEATIVMPTSAPFTKVTNTRALGAEVVQAGSTLAEARDTLERIRADEGRWYVPPFDDPHVIAGQGTVALEMLAECPDLDVLVAPVGGGGLLGGMAVAARALSPGIEIVGVQVEAYPEAWARFHHDRVDRSGPSEPVSSSAPVLAAVPAAPDQTVADGIAVKRPGAITMPLIERLVDDVVLVGEEATERAIALYAEIEKTVAEGAGAVALAAVLADPARFAGRRVGLVLSGGNIDTRLLASVLLRGLVRTERVSTLRMQVADQPGELARIMEVIGATGANVIDVEHRRTPTAATARGVAIDVVLETRDPAHRDEVLAALRSAAIAVDLVG